MAICPLATKRLIRPGSSDPRITPRVAILHVDAGNNDTLYPYFSGPSGGIESHFHIKKSGEIEQYRDTNYEADANYLANPFAVSIETQGYGEGEWTAAQLRSIKRLLTWLNEAHDIPLRQCPTWDGAGVGYHIQFGAPGKWTNVAKSCPGPDRIRQFHDVLAPWMTEGDPVSIKLSDIFRYRLYGKKGGQRTLADVLRQISADVAAIRRDVDDIKKGNRG